MVLVGINRLVFWKELIIEDSFPVLPYTHHLLWKKTGLRCGWWWFISLVPGSLPFHIIVQYPLFIARHNLFSLRLSRESHAEVRSRRFLCLTYVEPRHQSDEHNQAGANDFQCLSWIFWVCRLSPTWYNVDCSQCLDFIAINNWSTRPWSIVQQEISSTKLHKPLLTRSISHSTFSIHCTIVFAFLLRFYLSWNNEA